MKEPKVEVGILFEPQIEFILLTPTTYPARKSTASRLLPTTKVKSFGTAGNMTN